jgi:hypothetical protein
MLSQILNGFLKIYNNAGIFKVMKTILSVSLRRFTLRGLCSVQDST